MTRDSAAVAVLDDRRRRRLCPSSASAVDEGASPPASNGVLAASGSSSGGGCDEGTVSSKSSSAASTTTSCCGSSPSVSGSDDDDYAAVRRPADVRCPTAVQCPPVVRRPAPDDDDDTQPPSRDDDTTVVHRRSPNGGRLDDAASTANIGGRLTFYKDGKFIFQLAAHQQHAYNNQSAVMSSCRWVPVPTVIQQHKNSVKRVGESSSQHPQNKTIWPYLVTDQASSNSKSPQPIHQSQPLATMKSGDRRLQLSQSRTTPPPSEPFSGAVNLSAFNNTVVTATTQNIVRRPSRKYSISTLVENVSDLQHQNRQPQSLQLRNSSKLPHHHQNQSFMMVATKAIKALRCSKQRNSFRLKPSGKTELVKESLRPKSKKQPLVNLEQTVRHLWCRRHTSELLRRQLSLNDNLETTISTDSPASQYNSLDSSFTSMIMGGGKRRSLISPLSTSTITLNESRMSTSIEDNNPYKKYKLGKQQQRHIVANNGAKIGVSTMSANDHSITAILSSNASGTKRGIDVISPIMDSNTCFSTNTTSTYSNSIRMPHKNTSPAQPSLLRTLLKSPSCEIVPQSVAVSSNDSGYTRNHTFSSRKRSAIELTSLTSASEINKSSSITTPLMLPPTAGTNAANNSTAPHTNFQLPTLHPAATDQLTAAGYFNVLYHQAAMAAAMVYQNHSQVPQPLLKPTPLPKPQSSVLLPSQFSITNDANNSWQQQLNRRPPLLPLPEMVTVKVSTTVSTSSSSVSTIVAPRTSPLKTAIVNCSGLMSPNVPSSPPLLKHSIHPRNVLLTHMQEYPHQRYQQAPTVHQSSLYHKNKQHQLGSGVNKNIDDSVGYGVHIADKYAVDDKESISSVDCMPLNLSKDSAVENADSASTTATVR